MSVTIEAPYPARRGQPWPLCVLVGAAVIAGYVLFDHWWTLHGFAYFFRLWDGATNEVYRFIATMMPAALYAAVLAVWGIDARHRATGAVCALTAGLVTWGLGEWLQHVFERGVMAQSVLKTYDWTMTLVLPTLVALAWGLARRRDRVWVLGVAVAPLLAALDHHLMLHSLRWQSWHFEHETWWVQRLEFLAPAVIACLACWLLEAATRRTPDMQWSEMQSSA